MTKKRAHIYEKISPFDKKSGELNVVIETPKNCRNKYAFDEKLGVFVLKGVLAAGHVFPFDFGFIPQTTGGDGDPLDVLVLMDEPAFAGCLVPSRLIGVIEAEQTELDGKRERNFHELALERSSVEFFTLHWTVVHPITADSPLAGATPESMAASQAELLIFVDALEQTFSTRVSTRSSYLWDEIRWDVKFASIFANGPDGVIAIDVERLSRTERLDDGATRTPAAIERR